MVKLKFNIGDIILWDDYICVVLSKTKVMTLYCEPLAPECGFEFESEANLGNINRDATFVCTTQQLYNSSKEALNESRN